jgi:hypothetical protein
MALKQQPVTIKGAPKRRGLWTHVVVGQHGHRVHQEQCHRRNDQEPSQVVDFLRPNLDEEEIESPVSA